LRPVHGGRPRNRGRIEDETRTGLGILGGDCQSLPIRNRTCARGGERMRILARVADRALSAVVPQMTAAASHFSCNNGPYCWTEPEPRRCSYSTWQHRHRCRCSIPGGGSYTGPWTAWSPATCTYP